MKKRHIITIAAVAFLTALSVLFLDFVTGTRDWYRPPPAGADAIVVLTGGKGRTNEGLTLLRKGKARVLILSGVHEDADLDSIFLKRVSLTERSGIILEKRSRSTYENAVEVRKLMEERGLKSMVLITSGYHMKRARFIFSKIMPPGMRIDAYCVTTPNFDEDRWWSGQGLALMGIEFLKYCWYQGRFALLGTVAY